MTKSSQDVSSPRLLFGGEEQRSFAHVGGGLQYCTNSICAMCVYVGK